MRKAHTGLRTWLRPLFLITQLHGFACSEQLPAAAEDSPARVLIADDQVVRIDTEETTPTVNLQTLAAGTHFVVAEDRRRFATLEGSEFVVRDTAGHPLGQIHTRAPNRRHHFWGSDLLVPIVSSRDPHVQRVLAFEARTLADRTRLRIEAPNARMVRATQEHLTIAEPGYLTRYDRAGERQWRLAVGAQDLVVAARSDRVLLVDENDPRGVIHTAGEGARSRVDLSSPVWNLALDDDGRFSAVTTASRLYLFEEGHLRHAISLRADHGLRYATSLAISDAGEVLVGTQDNDARGRVLLFNHRSELLDQWQLGTDKNGFRPRVRFFADGRRLAVEHQGQLLLGSPRDALTPFLLGQKEKR